MSKIDRIFHPSNSFQLTAMTNLYLTLLLVINLFATGKLEKVTILDTRKATSDLGWTSSPGGWTEVTSTDETDVDLRTFEVCKIRRPNQNNWIRSSYLDVARARQIFIEIKFAIRTCQGIHQIHSCKNTFNIFYLPSNSADDEKATQMNEQVYTKLDTLAAGERFEAGTIRSFTETRSISYLSSDGIYIAFQDTGACMSIIYVDLFYKVCPETVVGLAQFPVTNTGQKLASLVEVKGQCVQNSMKLESVPMLHCNSEGNWVLSSGSCFCNKGYRPNRYHTQCEECPVGKYKSTGNNGHCANCPSNSYSFNTGASICQCSPGYFRTPERNPRDSCYSPPSAPLSPTSNLYNLSAAITWTKPHDFGGAQNVTYRVFCSSCDFSYDYCTACTKSVKLHPSEFNLKSTKVTAEGLNPSSFYKFKISSFNLVSSVSGLTPAHVELKLKTSSQAPPNVDDFRIISTNHNSAVLRWSSPHFSQPIKYQVQYSDGQNNEILESNQTACRLQHLQPDTSYSVKVRAQIGKEFGRYSDSISFSTTKLASKPNDNPGESSNGMRRNNTGSADVTTKTQSGSEQNHLVLAISLSCTLTIVLTAVLLLLCKKQNRFKKSPSNDILKYPMFENTTELLSHSTYVDPSTFKDPYVAVLQYAKEINPKAITFDKTIRSGEFGDVFKAVLNIGPRRRTVAVKTLKAGRNIDQRAQFLSEASIMGQFHHPNVIDLEGVVTKSRPYMIITEYMENGALDIYLKESKRDRNISQLVTMLQNIALGMKYLSELGFVHRDLAARNILLDSKLRCKITDFGLSRQIEKSSEEEIALNSRKRMIPIRWAAPEAWIDNLFSSSSDVWSFGVVTWEVLSSGEIPYWEMTNKDVIYFVESGYRLPAPCYCPIVLHKLMLECWNHDYSNRPSFTHLVSLLNYFLDKPTTLEERTNNRSPRSQDDCVPEIMDLNSLYQWLEEIHLLHYKPLMLRHGCVTAEQIMRLNQEELHLMGVVDRNDINTFLQQSGVLRFKIEEVNKIGVAV